MTGAFLGAQNFLNSCDAVVKLGTITSVYCRARLSGSDIYNEIHKTSKLIF